jgi:hypothetical protein
VKELHISMRTPPRGYIQRIFERQCETDSDDVVRKLVAA